MKKQFKIITTLLLILSVNFSFGQAQTWRWNFGNGAALNFPFGGPPVATIGSAMNTFEGCASIGTPAGALAFYTDGNRVWGSNNIQMPNGFGLFGNSSTTQAAIIVPRPGSANLYYIFACSSNFSPGNLSYSEVDMNLNAGFGNVTATKNVIIQTNIAEKLTAVRHCNGVDVWVICHDYTNSDYKAFLVTAAGVNAVPVVSSAGAPCSGNVVGAMKVSPNGRKIAYCASNGPFALHVADFNNSTGVVSNAINLAGAAALVPMYGLEFSPNSQILYGSKWAGSNQVYQWDLCGNAASIVASALMVGSGANTHGQMQLGPDGKIYIARAGSAFLAVINNPNTLGVGCGYVANGVSVAPGTSQYGLPTFIQSYLTTTLAPITSTVSCLNANFTSPTLNIAANCSINSNSISAYLWNFGDPASAANNTSTAQNPSHAYTTAGTYTVNLTLSLACGTVGLTHTLTVISCSPQVVVNSPTICSGNCAALTATASGGTGPYTYTWSPNIGAGAGPHNICPNTTTIYTIAISDANNIIATNTVAFIVNPTPTMVVASSSPTMCMNNFNGSVNTLTINANGATTYSWIGVSGITTTATTGSALTATALPPFVSGTGSVIGTIGTCTSMNTFSIAVIPNPVISVSSASMCFGTSAVLTASNASSYAWSPFNTLSAGTGSTVVAMPPVTTVYSVIGSSLNCNSTTETGTVTVIANPTVNIVSPSPTICAGTSIGLTAFGADNYSWSPGSTLDNTTNNVVVATPMVTTNYTVIGTSNTCTHIAVKQVIVVTLPNLQAICEKSVICYGDQTTINANGASTYNWMPATGLSSSTSNFVTANPGASTVYTLVASNGMCSDRITVPIIVVPAPLLNLSTSNQKICFGNSTTLFATGAQSYNWAPSVNNTSASSALISPSVSTNYTITGYNTSGTVVCAMTKEIEIEVVPLIVPSISNSVTICAGESVKLSAGGSNTFLWYPTTGLSSSSDREPYANPKITTVYSVEVSNGKNCPVTATVLVKVNPLPDVDAGPDVTFNLDEPMFLNGKGTGKLTWISGEGIICKDCPNTQIKPNNSSCYQLQALNEFGCKVVDEVCIEVSKDYNIYIPNVFTPNSDGNNDLFLVYGTGLNKLEIIVFDRWGEKLFVSNEQIKGWDGKYKGVDLKEDVYPYMVVFTSLDGKKHTKTGHVTLLK